MPDDVTPIPPVEPPGRRAPKPPAERKPRAPRKKAVVLEQAPALVVAPSPDEAVLAAGLVRQASEELDAAQARRDHLLESISAAEARLAALREEARALEDLTAVRAALDATAERVREAGREAGELHREADEAAKTFQEVDRLLDSTRASVETVRTAVAEADAAARAAEARAHAATAEAGRVRDEWTAHVAAARRTLDELRAAVEAAKAVPRPSPQPAPVQPAADAAPPPPADTIPDVSAVPAEAQAADAQERLLRYLNDAGAVAREQAGLLQTLADAAGDAGTRVALEAHREVNRHQQAAVEERVRALGGEPSAGRGLLGRVVTRVWDALQKPQDAGDAVEVLVQALGGAEFLAGTYLSVAAFARAIGDGPTAELMTDYFREERALADRLRGLIPAAAECTARRPAPAV